MENNHNNEPNNLYEEPNKNPYGEPIQNPYVNKEPDTYDYEEIPPTGEPKMDPVYTPPLSSNPEYVPPVTEGTNAPVKTGLAVAALVLGIIAIVTSCMGVNVIFGVIAIILGAVYLSKKQAERRGMAIAGLVLGIVSIALFVLMVVLIVAFAFSGAFDMIMSDPYYSDMYYDILNEMY